MRPGGTFWRRAIIVAATLCFCVGAANADESPPAKENRIEVPACRGRKVLLDAKDLPGKPMDISGVLKSKWRKRKDKGKLAENYWSKSGRLRLWYPNPNAAGTLFAEAAILLLMAAWGWRPEVRAAQFGRIAATCMAAVCVWMVFKTGSRGSFAALVAGISASCIATSARRRHDTENCKRNGVPDAFSRAATRWIVAAGAVLSILAVAIFSQNIFGRDFITLDYANMKRLKAWCAAPAMLAAAPGGWGAMCGIAYEEYFNNVIEKDPLFYLVSTHFTWAAAYGWAFTVFYITVHLFVFWFLASLARRGNRFATAALAVAAVLVVSGFFSTLGIYGSLWVLPAIMMAMAAYSARGDIAKSIRRTWIPAAVSLAAGVSTTTALVAIGHVRLATMPVPVHRTGNATYLGKGDPVVWIVPDLWTMARNRAGCIGADAREWLAKHPDRGTLAIAESLDDLPAKAKRVAYVGLSCLEYFKRLKGENGEKPCRADSMAFLTPPFPAKSLPDKWCARRNVKVYTGEYLARWTGDSNGKCRHLETIPGTDLYLPHWMDIVFSGRGG